MSEVNHNTGARIAETLPDAYPFHDTGFHWVEYSDSERRHIASPDKVRYSPDNQIVDRIATNVTSASDRVFFNYLPMATADHAQLIVSDHHFESAIEYTLLEAHDPHVPGAEGLAYVSRVERDTINGTIVDMRKPRQSDNPDRTFRALARLARITALHIEID